jgi:hypothetical protein
MLVIVTLTGTNAYSPLAGNYDDSRTSRHISWAASVVSTAVAANGAITTAAW